MAAKSQQNYRRKKKKETSGRADKVDLGLKKVDFDDKRRILRTSATRRDPTEQGVFKCPSRSRIANYHQNKFKSESKVKVTAEAAIDSVGISREIIVHKHKINEDQDSKMIIL